MGNKDVSSNICLIKINPNVMLKMTESNPDTESISVEAEKSAELIISAADSEQPEEEIRCSAADSEQLEEENRRSVVEEMDEPIVDRRKKLKKEPRSIKAHNKTPRLDRSLTSWECFTAVLSGLVEELIELGAQPKLRKISFQLWALYLKNESVAFISKTEQKLPSLPVKFKNSDAKVLYNIKNLRTLIINDTVNEHASRTCERKKPASENVRCKVKIPFAEKSAVNTEKLPIIGRSLSGSDSKKNVKIPLKTSVFNAIAEPARELGRQKEKHGDVPPNMQLYVQRQHAKRSNVRVTVNTLLGILKLALYLIEDEIQLTDLLRWVSEGRLSLYRVTKFLPKNSHIRDTDVTPCGRRLFMKYDLLRLSQILNLTIVPSPNLFKLIERYCNDLSLPSDFLKFTQKLMNMFTPHMDFAKYNYRVFPDYECRAMGFIVFALKILFALDGVTELKQSRFADTINMCNKKTSTTDVPVFFSWTSWVKYVECRKAVLCQYDVAMSQLYDSDDLRADVDVFLNYWSKTEPDTSTATSHDGFKKNTIDRLERAAKVQCVRDQRSERNCVKFPPSLTPLLTYSQLLISHHGNLLSNRSRQILSSNFNSCSIRYLLDHEWATSIGKNFELELKPVSDFAACEQVLYEEPKPNVITGSYTVPAHIPTPVAMVDDEDDDSVIRQTLGRLRKFNATFSSFEQKSNETDSLPFDLHYPRRNYWFFHNIDRSTFNENFNKSAIKYFPNSFIWLLKECSRILRCSLFELYTELVIIERLYYYIFADGNVSRKEKLVIYPNEW